MKEHIGSMIGSCRLYDPSPTCCFVSYGEARVAHWHEQPKVLLAGLPNRFYAMSEPRNRQSQLVGVIRPAGFRGSYLTAELIHQG